MTESSKKMLGYSRSPVPRTNISLSHLFQTENPPCRLFSIPMSNYHFSFPPSSKVEDYKHIPKIKEGGAFPQNSQHFFSDIRRFVVLVSQLLFCSEEEAKFPDMAALQEMSGGDKRNVRKGRDGRRKHSKHSVRRISAIRTKSQVQLSPSYQLYALGKALFPHL